MKVFSPYLNREEQALREVGQTTIRPALAWFLTGLFLICIYAVGIIQEFHDLGAPETRAHWSGSAALTALAQTPGALPARVFAANRQLLKGMHSLEDALEDESVVGRKIRPAIQYVLARYLGSGNEKAYCGVYPWLFYRADVDYLTGPGFLNPVQLARRAAGGNEWTRAPQPDPRPAILDFQRQLEKMGIQLVVLPIPPKTAIQPEKFSSRFKNGFAPLQNPSYAAWLSDLERSGVHVMDVTSTLLEAARSSNTYLATDTHWRPEAMELAARSLKQYIDRHTKLPVRPAAGYSAQTVGVTNRGDIAVMLRLPARNATHSAAGGPAGSQGYPPESVRLKQILTPRGEYFQADITADVLVLGDSFCNVYSLAAMGWGESAGLIEQLSFELQWPLDRLVINDNGAYATRALLARELARGRDRLAGKRLVIWQFAMRELSSGDWPEITLKLGQPEQAGFVLPQPGQILSLKGVVKTIAPVPRPGTVPYKDHIVAAHIVDLTDATGNGQALVYFESMRDNVWTRAARLRSGDTVMIALRPWSDVAKRYERINRTELPDQELQLIEPCWGKLQR
ncbi:MAG: hypothetical protein HYV35_06295 [Lentisphaerae bacterium]|nr:hypothetical protein [Lentisphaerota bacterium]